MNIIRDDDAAQIEVEQYLRQERVIPHVSKTKLVLLIILILIIFIGLVFGVLALAQYFGFDLWFYLLVYSILVILLFEIGIRIIAIYAVKCYQRYASKEVRMQCICKPTCSEYAIGVLKKYLLIHAFYKIYYRLHYTCTGNRYKINLP